MTSRGKVASIGAAIIGWGGAGALIFTGDTTRDVLAQAFLIGVGATGLGWRMLCARSRPMVRAFELGEASGFERGFQAGRETERCATVGGRVVRLEGRRRVSV